MDSISICCRIFALAVVAPRNPGFLRNHGVHQCAYLLYSPGQFGQRPVTPEHTRGGGQEAHVGARQTTAAGSHHHLRGVVCDEPARIHADVLRL